MTVHIDASRTVFGTFHLRGEEFALPATSVREVVQYPEHIVRLPMVPPFVLGVFNLRQQVLPIVDLGVLLELGEGMTAPDRQVAIVCHEGVDIGVVFDGIGEVLSVGTEQLSELDPSDPTLVGSIARLDGGQRLLKVLDAACLAGLDQMPHIENRPEEARRRKLVADSKAISFVLDDVEYAFPMASVIEILPYVKLVPCRVDYKHFVGMLTVRGQTVAALDLRAALGGERTEPTAQMRLVVVDLGGALGALLVDGIRSVLAYRSEELLRFPRVSKTAYLDCFEGILNVEPGRDVLLCDVNRFLEGFDARQPLASLYRLERSAVDEADRKVERSLGPRVFIVFHLGEALSIEIGSVREIVRYPEVVVALKGTGRSIRGLFNLRGTMVPVIDLRAHYGMAPFEDLAKSFLMITMVDETLYGLMIDSVDAITKVELLALNEMAHEDGDCRKYAIVRDAAGVKSSLITFDAEIFLRENVVGSES